MDFALLRVVKIPPTSTAKRWYVFSGTTLIGEVSSSGATLAYTHGADGLVSMRDVTTNTTRFFHFGAQGETRYLTNSSGAVTDSYYYEAYGNQVASTGSTYNPYRYGGKFGYYNDDLGESLLATWRWYSPSQMRWINRDPIKFDGGSNVYQYVSGNPVKFVDPSGLDAYNPYYDHDVYVVDEDGNWFKVPPRSVAPVSPDGWYDPKTDKTYKTRGAKNKKIGPFTFSTPKNDVICEEYSGRKRCGLTSSCGMDFMSGFGPYEVPNGEFGATPKNPKIHPKTKPIPNWFSPPYY